MHIIKYILGILQAYLRLISLISQVYLMQFWDKSQEILGAKAPLGLVRVSK